MLLCAPLRRTEDKKLLLVALRNCKKLAVEKHVLITKAISWVLRSGCESFPKEIDQFLKENGDKLPKIAVRETITKLRTGRKTKRK